MGAAPGHLSWLQEGAISAEEGVWTFRREAELGGGERKVEVGGGGRQSSWIQPYLKAAMAVVAPHCFTLLCQVGLSQVRLRFGASGHIQPKLSTHFDVTGNLALEGKLELPPDLRTKGDS